MPAMPCLTMPDGIFSYVANPLLTGGHGCLAQKSRRYYSTASTFFTHLSRWQP
jgi:hypothetical protein